MPLKNYFSTDEKRTALEELDIIQTHRNILEERLEAKKWLIPLLGTLILQAYRGCLEACPTGEQGRDQRIELLGFLAEEAGKWQWHSKEHEKIVEVFFEHFSCLPWEDRFPTGEGREDIKKLFISLSKHVSQVKNFSDPLTAGLRNFQHRLSLEKDKRAVEQFVKLLPLQAIGFDTVEGIREISRREAFISGDDFKTLFDFYVGPNGGRFILGNGAAPFIQGASVSLLRRVLTHYPDDFHLAENIVKGFKEMTSLEESQEKLVTFIEWYSKYQAGWSSYRQAHRLFFILSMAVAVIEKNP